VFSDNDSNRSIVVISHSLEVEQWQYYEQYDTYFGGRHESRLTCARGTSGSEANPSSRFGRFRPSTCKQIYELGRVDGQGMGFWLKDIAPQFATAHSS
jgi:hypothetical protein